jgi:hypothetical protein
MPEKYAQLLVLSKPPCPHQIDGVVVKNDKTDLDSLDDPDGNAAAAAVDCAAVESKGGAVAELAPRNVSNPGKGGRLPGSCPGRGFPISYKVRLDRRRRGSIGGSSSSRCNASADHLLLLPQRHDGLRWVLLGVGSFCHKKQLSEPSRVGSTCNVGKKLATYAHVADMLTI